MPELAIQRVLVTGSSTTAYAETSAGQAEYAMLEAYLRRAQPEVDWRCEAEIIYVTRSMPERTARALESRQPDVVVLRLVGGQFFNEYVVERIRQIAPRLYRWSREVAEWWRDLAGGGPHGNDDARGWVYRFPRWLLIKTIGTAPRITVEDAIVAVTRTIDEVLKAESAHLLVRLPSYPRTPDTNLKEYERRITLFGQAVREHCYKRRVPFYDWADVRQRADHVRVIGPDRWHPTIDDRDLDARTMAQAVIAVVEGGLKDIFIRPSVEVQTEAG